MVLSGRKTTPNKTKVRHLVTYVSYIFCIKIKSGMARSWIRRECVWHLWRPSDADVFNSGLGRPNGTAPRALAALDRGDGLLDRHSCVPLRTLAPWVRARRCDGIWLCAPYTIGAPARRLLLRIVLHQRMESGQEHHWHGSGSVRMPTSLHLQSDLS